MARDALLALVLTAWSVAAAFVTEVGGVTYRQPDIVGIGLAVLMALPLVWRRRRPVLVLSLVGAATALYSLFGYGTGFVGLGPLIAFYSVAAHAHRRVTVIAAVFTFIGVVVSILVSREVQGGAGVEVLTANLVVYFAAWVLGDNLRVRRAYTRELEARAARLEHEREADARAALAVERARVARELHDVVAHSVSVMVVQAGAARRVVESLPADATEALSSIETTGRQALTELRRMLGMLRADDDGSLDPQPGLASLEMLLTQVREAGLPVDLEVAGGPRTLPAGIDLSAYRIVQEALTNALRHAGPARATVRLRYEQDALDVEITDDGRGPRGNAAVRADDKPAGHGLVGMRERVAMFGGHLEVGAAPGQGFRVSARLPLDAQPWVANR